MPLKQLVIAHVWFEPERKGVTYPGNDSDDLVQQNIKRHPGEKYFRQTASRGVDQRQGWDNRWGGIAESRNKSDDRIKTETELCSRQAQELIHNQCEPLEQRLELRLFLLFFGWEDLPHDFACFGRFLNLWFHKGRTRLNLQSSRLKIPPAGPVVTRTPLPIIRRRPCMQRENIPMEDSPLGCQGRQASSLSNSRDGYLPWQARTPVFRTTRISPGFPSAFACSSGIFWRTWANVESLLPVYGQRGRGGSN